MVQAVRCGSICLEVFRRGLNAHAGRWAVAGFIELGKAGVMGRILHDYGGDMGKCPVCAASLKADSYQPESVGDVVIRTVVFICDSCGTEFQSNCTQERWLSDEIAQLTSKNLET